MNPPKSATGSSFFEIRRQLFGFSFAAGTRLSALFVLVLFASMIGSLTFVAWPVLSKSQEVEFFTSKSWVPEPPTSDDEEAEPPKPKFGALSFIYGTLVTSFLAILVAVPLGVGSAAYMAELGSSWTRKVGAFFIELLAAIPSVVYGFWGIWVLAPQIQKLFVYFGSEVNNGGQGIISSGLVLAIMILPYITAISFDVCRAVPRSQREGALALGATRWQTIRHAVLPYARPGIIAATFLALGRALGETMAVMMLSGNKAVIELTPWGLPNPTSLCDTLAGNIANKLLETASTEARAAYISLGVLLMVVTGVVNIAARLILARLGRERRVKSSTAQAAPETPATPLPVVVIPPPGRMAPVVNFVMTMALRLAFLITIVPLFMILGEITYRGAASVEWRLFANDASVPSLTNTQFTEFKQAELEGRPPPLDEVTERPLRRGGLGHAMVGSLIMVFLAAIVAVPIGIAAAVYLSESRSSYFATAVRFFAEILGGVPSIVLGVFAYSLLVYPFWLEIDPQTQNSLLILLRKWLMVFGNNNDVHSPSALAGAAALAIMMLPIVIRSSEEAMRLVPDSLRQASYALGATRVRTILNVVIPASRSAIVTGVFLAIGRIAGETAPLLVAAGSYDYWHSALSWNSLSHPLEFWKMLNEPSPFLTKYIQSWSTGLYDDQKEQAWGGAFVLLATVMVINIGIRLASGNRVVAAARSD